jgi:hypothetical protein
MAAEAEVDMGKPQKDWLDYLTAVGVSKKWEARW